ncbi:MAG TPA: DUF86 domain-containing protein [Promineifilum sp.]|nr:DUF86 domain-containing protein [Promineifilum sp.]
MSRHDEIIRLHHVRDHTAEAISMADGKTRDDLDADRMLELALVRLMEIIGEAAGRISPETRAKLPEIPWSDVVAMRNRLIHGYDNVDHDILWDTITHDLPLLLEAVDNLIEQASN